MKRDNRYQRGKIYKIICNVTGLCYIGSTIQTLSARLGGHRRKYKAYLKGNQKFLKSFDIIKTDDYKIELVEEYPCWSKMQLERQEGKHQREIECVNVCIAGRKKHEYYQDNKQHISNHRKQYYRDNKHLYKQRYEDNKEIIIKKSKQHYQDNKEKIKHIRSINYDCECGSHYTIQHRARHFKTKKHQDYMNS